MIFERVMLTIEPSGTIHLGGSDLVAYSFHSRFIECSDKDLRYFGYGRENALDKSKYETPLMYCVETKSLYINSLNWYRFKNALPLDSEDNYTARFCKVNVIVSSAKPDTAFAKFKKTTNGKTVYLTCPLISRKNSTASADVGYNGMLGAPLTLCALESREIFPKNNNITALIPSSTNKSVVTFVAERDPNGVKDYARSTTKISLYVAISGGVMFSRVGCTVFGYISNIVLESNRSTILVSGLPVQPTNTRYMSELNDRRYRYFYNQIVNAISLSGDLYYTGGYGVGGTYTISNIMSMISNVKVVEFDTYAEFSLHLSSKYKTGDTIQCKRLRVSDFYSNKACTMLVAVRGGLSSCIEMDSENTVFIDINNTPDIIWQDRSAYLDMSTKGDGIVYVIKQPVDYKIYPILGFDTGKFVYGSEKMGGITISPAGSSSYVGTSYNPVMITKSPNKKMWIPNCMFNEMLEHFTDMEVFSSYDDTLTTTIYNNKINYYGHLEYNSAKVTTAIKFSKTTFLPIDVGPSNTANIATGSSNMNSSMRTINFDHNIVNVGSKLPLTDHPATKISEIMYYSSVAFVRFTVV